MSWRCTVYYGSVPYVRAVYCMLGWCTLCYGGVLCGRLVYCVLGCVLYVMLVSCEL